MTTSFFQTADRLQQLPPYLFAEIDRLKQEELKKGKKLISLSIGDPDLPTPQFVLDRMSAAIRNPEHHQYPSHSGLLGFRQAIAAWYQRHFQVALRSESEILPLIGSKEGIAHLPLAFVNPGDEVLVPDPGYPVYAASTVLAGGRPVFFPLRKENQFLPDLKELEKKLSPRTRVLFLNYPNNPTSACASSSFFQEVVAFAHKHRLLVCHDLAYSEVYFDGKRQPSFLETPGALEIGCEFHSLSKTFNMTGWRIGFVVGQEKILKGLSQVKSNIDSGLFHAVQEAGIAALEEGESFCNQLRALYQERRDLLQPALEKIGLRCHPSDATFYLWAELSSAERDSEKFTLSLLKNKGILTVPGKGFGAAGEGYVRFTLCANKETLTEVVQRLGVL